MFDAHRFVLFFAAAFVLAVTPGPGIFYVLARSLAGGRREGIQSSLGTFVGGLFHVFAAALGVSAILAASAVAFHTVKYAGAAYLVWLGIRLIRTRNAELAVETSAPLRGAFRQGIWTEALNLLVVLLAAPLERKLKHSAKFRRRQRLASGLGMIGLGAYVAFADSK
jgi:threonine/homoserine/homoserine lactone efflux protein